MVAVHQGIHRYRSKGTLGKGARGGLALAIEAAQGPGERETVQGAQAAQEPGTAYQKVRRAYTLGSPQVYPSLPLGRIKGHKTGQMLLARHRKPLPPLARLVRRRCSVGPPRGRQAGAG